VGSGGRGRGKESQAGSLLSGAQLWAGSHNPEIMT